jgi:uncharacterized membrane protein YeiH
MVPYLVDLSGVAFFAASGAMAAGRKNLDLLGVVVIALVTAVGGGTVRDLLLARHPIFWIADPMYVYAIAGAALVAVPAVRLWRPPASAVLGADAVGLALFAVAGTRITLEAGHPPPTAVLMGAVTGTAGGVIRDVMLNDIPVLFRGGPLYATAALIGCTLYLVLAGLGVPTAASSAAGMVAVIALRAVSIAFGLGLPVFRLEDGRSDADSDGGRDRDPDGKS